MQDEQIGHQLATAAAAPTAPMVKALETRLSAHPSHLPMYSHHLPSRVTAQVLGEAQSHHCSSCSRRWSSCGAAQQTATMSVAAQCDCACRRVLGRAHVTLACGGVIRRAVCLAGTVCALSALYLVLGVVRPPPDTLHDPSRSHVSLRADLVVYGERVSIVIKRKFENATMRLS